MAKATRPTIAAKTLLPAASMLAPLPGVKVAGAEVVALVGAVLATAVPVAIVVLLAVGKGAGAAIVMVSGVMDDVILLTTGAEEVVTGVEEAGVEEAAVEEAAVGVDEVTGAAEALPLGPTQGMVSMKTGKH